MEKLQAALDQARKKRGDGDRVTFGTSGGTTERKAQERWEEIKKLHIDANGLNKKRLVSIAGGQQATVFDVLRTKILQMMSNNDWRRVAITSPTPGCGKTTLAANLAASFGRQVDMRTMLVDMDMRRPSLAKLMGHKDEFSVFDVLEERVDYADQARKLGPNVAFSMNYGPARDPSDLFLRKRTGEVLDEIENAYRPGIMIFDMPPMLANDDTAAFLPMTDCVLLVAEAEVTTVKQIDSCEKELSEQTNVLGVALNKCRFADDDYGYKYSY